MRTEITWNRKTKIYSTIGAAILAIGLTAGAALAGTSKGEKDYLRAVYDSAGANLTSFNDEELLEFGYQACDRYDRGATKESALRIVPDSRFGSDNWGVSIGVALFSAMYLCPENRDKIAEWDVVTK